MLNKEEIVAYLKDFSNQYVERKTQFGITIKYPREGKTIASIAEETLSDEAYEISYVYSSEKGIGKFLYFLLMNKMYPKYLVASEVLTGPGRKLHEILANLDYVEKKMIVVNGKKKEGIRFKLT